MRTALACLLLTGLLPAGTMAPQLGNVKTIYLLPMANSLDQYIANRLTRESRFAVSTDPQTADAVMTDRVGEPFEKRMTELYPPPPPPAPAASEKGKDKDQDSDTKKDVVKDEPLRMGGFSRGKGTVFLVDRSTRRVLWSDYRRPRNSSADEINHVADKIVERLVNDAKPGK